MRAINDFVIIEETKLGVKTSESGLQFAESLDDESRYRKGILRTPNEALGLVGGEELLYDKMAGNSSPELPEMYKIMRWRDVAVIL